eukprot:3829422-Amphidinium_carterae.1
MGCDKLDLQLVPLCLLQQQATFRAATLAYGAVTVVRGPESPCIDRQSGLQAFERAGSHRPHFASSLDRL